MKDEVNVRKSRHIFLLFPFLFLFFMVFGVSSLLQAQRYLSKLYSIKDGLANATVYDITQDKRGQMWFAAAGGISCYDGSGWINYSPGNGLPHTGYFKIQADKEGNIWALTQELFDGISFFDARHQRWRLIKPPRTEMPNQGPISVNVMALLETRQQVHIAIGTEENGLYIYNKYGWVQTGSGAVRGILAFGNSFYLTAEKGIFRMMPVSPFNWETLAIQVPSWPVYSLAVVPSSSYTVSREAAMVSPSLIKGSNQPQPNTQGLLWLAGKEWVGYCSPFPGSNRFHLLYRGELPGFTDIKLYKKMTLLPDHYGGLWAANELVFLNIDNTGLLSVQGLVEGLSASGANTLFYDRESHLWVGTMRGIMKITSFRFENFRRVDGLYDDEVSAILQLDNGEIIFGHNGGLTFYRDNQFQALEIPGLNRRIVVNSRVMDMCTDKAGNIWAAINHRGILRITPDRVLTWCKIDNAPPGENEELSFSAILHHDGNLWAAGQDYIYRWEYHRFTPIEIDKKFHCYFRRLFADGDSLYIATNTEGLLRLTGNKITQFLCADNREANSIYSFYRDRKGNMLVGTKVGLYRWENNSLVKFRHQSLQIDNPVYFIIEDHRGCLWFGLNNGVICWDGHQARHFTPHEGLVGYETNRAASLVDKGGKIWIGTENGVSCYNKKKDRTYRIPPLMELLYLEVPGQSQRYSLNRVNIFNYRQDDLTFHFKGISFNDETAVRYNLKLEGYDKEWIRDYRALQNQVRYLNVPPGKYRFHVQAVNSLGVKSKVVSSGLITINHPFYQTWWFYFIVITVIMVILFLAANFISKRQYAARLEKQIYERTHQLENSEREFRDIFNNAHDAILILDPATEIILDANQRGCEIYGFSPGEFIGMSLERVSKDIPRGKKKIQETLNAGECYSFETVQYRKDGSEMFLEINASVIDYRGKTAILSLNRDITGRKRAEEQIKASLKEKETLLKEIHHRVKNNLQVISSLLDLHSDTLDDEEIQNVFQGSKDRIHAMAMVHENLYRFGDLARIDALEYIRNLTVYLMDTYRPRPIFINPVLDIKLPSLALDMEIAIPIGMILTELISNALKHAFPSGQADKTGEVRITLQSLNPGTLTLEVRDTGVGLPTNFNPRETRSLGLQLIHLLTQQIKGTIEMKTDNGTVAIITFPLESSSVI